MPLKILVESGNYFSDNVNFGDLAIYRSIASLLRNTFPDCEIRWVTRMRHKDTRRRCRNLTIPRRGYAIRLAFLIKQLRLKPMPSRTQYCRCWIKTKRLNCLREKRVVQYDVCFGSQ